MNILLINHYAGCPQCGMEFRPFYLAKEWTKQGHNVTILAANFSHLRRLNPDFVTEIKEQNIDAIKYLWIKTPEYQGNGLSRIKNIFSFVRKINQKASSIANDLKPDAVIASSTYPMDIVPAKKIAKKSGAKLIFEIHDLWPLSPMELGGYSKLHPFIAFVQHYENYAYKHSDAVVSILPKTKEHCTEHGLSAEKWHHIPNGIFLDDWNNSKPIPDEYKSFFEKIKANGKKIIGYAGGHAISNALETIIDAAHQLKNDKRFFFVLVGDGAEKSNLMQKAEGLNNIKFFDPLPKNSIPNLLSYFDILYIGWHKSPLYRFGISPNKVFDYMMAAKPIIHAVEAGNDPVQDAQCGISIEPENTKALIDAINNLANLPEKEINILGQRAKEYVMKNHLYSKLADDFLKIIENA